MVGIIDDIHNSIGIDLVKSGYLVLVPDRRGFGEFQPVAHYIEPSCGRDKIDGRILLERDTQSFFQTNDRSMDVNDMLIALDYLYHRKDVDNIGIIGLSGGGVVASYVTGISDKVNGLVLSNSFGYLEELDDNRVSMNSSELETYIYPRTPNQKLKFYEKNQAYGNYNKNVDNMYLTPLALLPNCPLLIQFGENDSVSKKTRDKIINYIKAIYSRFKSEDLLEISIESGRSHEFVSPSIINFLNDHLK